MVLVGVGTFYNTEVGPDRTGHLNELIPRGRVYITTYNVYTRSVGMSSKWR